MQQLLTDLWRSLRVLRRHPGYALVAVAVLGLGIGATTVTYSILRGAVLRSLPFPESERLVYLEELEEGSIQGVSVPTFLDWRQEQEALASMAIFLQGSRVLTGRGAPREVGAALVSPEFFQTLGVRPSPGRGFTPEDHEPGAEAAVVVSYGFWRSELGGDPGTVGGTLTLGETRHRIIGVAPPDRGYPAEVDLWISLMAQAPQFRQVRGAHIFSGIGRLSPGATPRSAEEELSRLSRGIPDYGGEWRARVTPLRQAIAGDARGPLFTLMGAVLFLLLVASANVANLSIARTYSREREMALRRALGASPGQVASLLLSESILVALAAGAAGVLLTFWGLDLVLALIPGGLPRADEIGVDGSVLAFAVLVSVVTGLLAGLAPALRGMRSGVASALKDGGTGVAGRTSSARLRKGLVVAEVALTVILLTGGALLLRSFAKLVSVDPGFQAESVWTFSLSLPEYRYPEEAQWQEFHRELLSRLEGLQQVSQVALARNLPVSGSSMTSPIQVEGGTPAGDQGPRYVQVSTVSPDYFAAMGIPVLEGRAFQRDDRQDAPPVAVVNESFARAFFPGGRAPGQRARSFFEDEMRQIVGVVGDVHHSDLAEDAPPVFYVPLAQDPHPGVAVVFRSSAGSEALLPAIRSAVAGLDARLPVVNVTTMEARLGQTVMEPRFYATLLGGFALLALIVAALGLYGVMVSSVASRQGEMGIRLAMGARGDEVLALVLREALLMAGAGTAIGLVGALGMGRLLQGLLFEVGAADPAALLAGAAVALIACTLAAWVPARRASKVNPVDVLRV